MGTRYNQLTLEDRDQIALLKVQGKSAREIGRILGRHHTTIIREMSRNGSRRRQLYTSHKADENAKVRKRLSSQRDRLKSLLIREYVEEHLKKRWSPEQIAGRLTLEFPHLSISHEAIYQYIYKESPRFIACLPRRYKKRHKRGWSRKLRRCHIRNRTGIEERPSSIQERLEIGHWEADLAVSSRSRTSLNVLCERRSRYVMITKLKDKTARFSRESICKRLQGYPQPLRQTITYDNGPENAGHQFVNRHLGTRSYFCRPHHSWEKGTVENTIGLIRRYLPKKTDLSRIRDTYIQIIEKQLNNRPRKCLEFSTPEEVFRHLGGALAR